MGVSATRRVSATGSSSANKAPRAYSTGSSARGQSFVEVIEGAGGVEIKGKFVADKESENQESYKREDQRPKNDIKATVSYVTSALEALSASGVFDEVPSILNSRANVYTNNQNIINGDEDDGLNDRHDYFDDDIEDNSRPVFDELNEFI